MYDPSRLGHSSIPAAPYQSGLAVGDLWSSCQRSACFSRIRAVSELALGSLECFWVGLRCLVLEEYFARSAFGLDESAFGLEMFAATLSCTMSDLEARAYVLCHESLTGISMRVASKQPRTFGQTHMASDW